MRILSLAHSVYQHQYHIVWGTKYRRKFLKDYVRPDLVKSFQETIEHYPTLHLDAVNVDNDHVHIQIEISPDIAVSKAVQILKQNASRNLKRKFPFIRRMYLTNSIWSVGYFSSTIGLNEQVIRRYIEHQGKQELPKQVKLGFA
jgi:putative transposase